MKLIVKVSKRPHEVDTNDAHTHLKHTSSLKCSTFEENKDREKSVKHNYMFKLND